MIALHEKPAELRFEVCGRQICARTSRYSGRLYVDSISQVVKRPRAYGEVQRKLWPTAKPNAIAVAALAHLGASPDSGFINESPAALARVQGGAA